jgi:hypothetical protein
MNVVLWIAAGILAVLYLGAGITKLTKSRSELLKNPNFAWVADFSQGAVRGIGLVEVLGAVGLILPQATGIAPVLTPIAAIGLAIVQLGAAVTHARRKEYKMLSVNIVLLLLALLVAIGRFAG